MADRDHALAENVPGRCYVDDSCIDCDLCRRTAPLLFSRNDAAGRSFVSAQPSTPDEDAVMRQAIEDCPVEAIGGDREVAE